MPEGTSRVVVLMTPKEKAKLEGRARRAGISVGEFVRRAVEAYDLEERRAEIEAMLAELGGEGRDESYLAESRRRLEELERQAARLDRRLIRVETALEWITAERPGPPLRA